MAKEADKTFKAASPKTLGRIYSDIFSRYGSTLSYTLNFSMNCSASGSYFDDDWQCKLYLDDSEIYYSYVKGRTGKTIIGTTEYFMISGTKSGTKTLTGRAAGSVTIKVEARYGYSKTWANSTKFTTNSWILYYGAIAAPPSPTLTYELKTPVDGENTEITITAAVANNPDAFYTLYLEETTSGSAVIVKSSVGATSQAQTYALTTFYDKTRTFRARIAGDNIDSASNNVSITIPSPTMPMWFHDGTQLRQAKKVYYFPTANTPKQAKAVWYNNGGAYDKK